MTDKQILKFASAFRNGIIGRKSSAMRCYMVSAPLATLLCMNGISCKMVEGEVNLKDAHCNHFWIELADGRVLDPTADQFNHIEGFPELPKVYLGERSIIHGISKNMQPSGHIGQGVLIA